MQNVHEPTEVMDSDLNLASLASRAAIALDNMSLGRNYSRAVILALAQQGSHRLSEANCDRTAILAVYSALQTDRVEKFSALQHEDDAFISDAQNRFKRLLELENASPTSEEIKELRKFCVALSRSMSAFQSSPFDAEDQL